MWTPELKKINQIQFGILSPDEIRKMAVTKIITADTYNEDGTPIEGGLIDRRLGTIEPGQRCKTCGNQVGDCPGHFGMIELARPVVHVGYAKSIIYKLLRSTCRACSRILLDNLAIKKYQRLTEKAVAEDDIKTTSELVKEVVKEARKKSECSHCSQPQYKIKYEKPTSFYEETPEGSVRITPSEIQKRFEGIQTQDLTLLGIDANHSRPEWMILSVLPVPPVSVRASITLESGVRSEDDLTHKLVDIIRINQRLRENIEAGAPQLIVEDLWELLQYHVTTFMDNEVAGIPPARHRSGRALRTLTQRLRGKEGRFRGNLSGKRVDFSARTVVSPDPNISINEVGVPEQIAKILTVPERVTEWNIEEMKELVMNGPNPEIDEKLGVSKTGSNYIIRPDGKRIDLRFVGDLNNTAEMIDQGFIVERHLRDGDMVLFNRQPSLHRMSIMAHEVRVMPFKTFRLHLCVCTPYNADFDGDEMNLHVPQSEEARAETRVLMRVQEQILSPRYGGPIIGALHDYVSASFLLTRKKSLISKEDVWQLLLSGNYEGELPSPAISYPTELWTGKQVFSLLLPSDVNVTTKSRTCRKHDVCKGELCEYDSSIYIRSGQLLSGVIDRRAIGADESESVLHVVVKDHGSDRAREFLDSLTQMLLEFLSHEGFSLGYSNINMPEEGKKRITALIGENEKAANDMIDAYRRGELEPLPGKSLEETLEMRIMSVLAKARDSAGSVANDYMGISNSAVVMASTGAKGTQLNIAQMAACVGQQSIRGERILRGYRKRSLPHFQKNDIGPVARGFVRSNYRTGLSPTEFFFHAQGGREGLVDTAVRTSTSGYLQRRLVNALQDLHVNYDIIVRTTEGDVVQLRYGEDGVDPMKSYHGRPVDIDAIIEEVTSTEED
ncbi:MAG: DNA-directed RNA polymerase subunit A' [Candidatus Hodarchaeales archaeon]|jgi:DNA-directed RNA polymerase subunit A'